MNILIVDDEFYSAKSTQKKISEHYEETFEEILCAFSKEQALKICDKIDISILICDIEMPGGSGLSLLNELREKKIDTVCIFLTAYAKFEYVSEALKLDSVDYLLKPIDDKALFNAVDKACSILATKQSISRSIKDAEILDTNRPELANLFWTDLINGNIKSDYESILIERKKKGLTPIARDTSYIPLLVQTIFHSSDIPMEKDLFEFVIRNILSEYFFHPDEKIAIASPDIGKYLLPLLATGRDKKSLAEKCRLALQDFVPRFPAGFIFYIAKSEIGLEDFADYANEMLSISSQNVALENYIFDLSKDVTTFSEVADFNFPESHWNDFLLRRDTDSIFAEADIYLTSLRHSGEASRDTLRFFYHKFLNLLSASLKEKDKSINDAFSSKALRYEEDKVTASFYNIREWMQNILALYDECLSISSDENQPVAIVRAYIKEHLGEDLSREALASMVYLTPDYLSHLFKKEVNMSLTNYVISERIKESKRLLANTNLSIQDIAIQCGFQNISYFSRQFRSFTGMTPREFRK